MDFSLTSEHEMIRETAQRFARQALAPLVEECERQERFPMEAFRKAGELGLLGSFFPPEYGGSGSDLLSNAIIIEEFAKVSASFALSVDVSVVYFGYNLLKLGSPEQKQKYLPDIIAGKKIGCFALTEPNAGSDTLSLTTMAKPQGEYFVINGSKIFITNAPIADYFMVVTRTSPRQGIKGGTTFIVERDGQGMDVREMHGKMGVHSSPTGEIYFSDLRVHQSQILGQQDQGFVGMMRSLNMERAIAPAIVVGMAQDCLDRCLAYVKTREQFGRPISEYQLIQAKLAEMAIGVETSRAYLHKVIWMVENGMDVTKEAAILKYHASRVATKAALEAVQIHGGYGYMQEYGVERTLRDAKLMEIGGGTNEIQLLVIARELLRA